MSESTPKSPRHTRRQRTSPSTRTPAPSFTARPRKTGWLFGPSRPTDCPGRRRSPRCWTGRGAVRQVVRGRRAQRRLQLCGSSRRGRPWRSGRHPLEGEPVGDRRTLTYSDLLAEVSKAANALTDLGLVAGDRVAIYLPLIPEAVIAMLACARLGIMHSVVFGGFTAAALQARIVDARQAADHRGRAVSARQAIAPQGGR